MFKYQSDLIRTEKKNEIIIQVRFFWNNRSLQADQFDQNKSKKIIIIINHPQINLNWLCHHCTFTYFILIYFVVGHISCYLQTLFWYKIEMFKLQRFKPIRRLQLHHVELWPPFLCEGRPIKLARHPRIDKLSILEYIFSPEWYIIPYLDFWWILPTRLWSVSPISNQILLVFSTCSSLFIYYLGLYILSG